MSSPASARSRSAISTAPANSPSTPTITLAQPGSAESSNRSAAAGSARVPPTSQPFTAPYRDPVPIHEALDALPGILEDVLGKHQLDLTRLRAVDERLGHDVSRELVHRRRQPQQLVLRQTIHASHPLDLGTTMCQRSGLVQENGASASEPLDRSASLGDHAAPSRPRHARDQGNRRGQDQRTRGRHDQYGKRANRIAAQRPGGPGYAEGDRQQDGRVTVGHPNEGSALLLGLANQLDDAGVGTLGGRPRGPNIECIAGAHRATRNGGAPRVRVRAAALR